MMQGDRFKDLKNQKVTYILVLVLLVGVTTFTYLFRSDDSANGRIVFSNDGSMTITSSAGVSETIRYDEIASAALYTAPDYGTPAGGTQTDSLLEGLWHSKAFGDYTASIDTSIGCCVFIRTGEKAYAVNLENDQVTKSFYEALTKLGISTAEQPQE